MLDKELLELMVCPDSRAPLVQDGERLVSTDPATRRSYPIEDGIPRMLIESSEQLDQEEWEHIMQAHGVER